MKLILPLFLLLLSTGLFSQDYPSEDYYTPFKYPKRYTFDGANKIIELNGLLAAGNAGYGGDVKFDFVSIKLGTAALRLNFGAGAGCSSAKTEKNFAPTPLLSGAFGENYVKDVSVIPNLQLYSRLWIRVLNPFNISIVGGGVAYCNNNTTTAHFSIYNNGVFQLDEQEIEHEAKKSKVGVGYFVEAKAMINFKNWGVSGGVSKYFFTKSYSFQPVVGLWFGMGTFERPDIK